MVTYRKLTKMNAEKLAHPVRNWGLWERWKKFGRKIGDFQARALLSVFYFIILAPFALMVRWLTDPLALKPNTSKGWQAKKEGELLSRERAGRQF